MPAQGHCVYHCSACDLHFASLAAFDAHRVGPASDRHCDPSKLVPQFTDGTCQHAHHRATHERLVNVTIYSTPEILASHQALIDAKRGEGVTR